MRSLSSLVGEVAIIGKIALTVLMKWSIYRAESPGSLLRASKVSLEQVTDDHVTCCKNCPGA
jgi:hypothetical protein